MDKPTDKQIKYLFFLATDARNKGKEVPYITAKEIAELDSLSITELIDRLKDVDSLPDAKKERQTELVQLNSELENIERKAIQELTVEIDVPVYDALDAVIEAVDNLRHRIEIAQVSK